MINDHEDLKKKTFIEIFTNKLFRREFWKSQDDICK